MAQPLAQPLDRNVTGLVAGNAQEKILERVGIEALRDLMRDFDQTGAEVILVELQLAQPPFTQLAKVSELGVLRLSRIDARYRIWLAQPN